MKKLITLFVAVLLLSFFVVTFVACNDEPSAPASTDKTMDDNLLFFDDFDTLNTDVWNVYSKNITDGSGNVTEAGYGYQEILDSGVRKGGYWDKNQVLIEDGNLILRTSEIDGKYYTGAIDTDNKFETHYGYYEARVYLPEAYGIWAAFWIMCDDMGKATTDAKVAGSEIDIFESPFYAPEGTYLNTDVYQSAIHIGNYDSSDSSAYEHKAFISKLMNKKALIYGDWHVFSLDWQENYYRFYCDGKLMFETNMDGNISDRDSFLFLSVEVDGANGNAYKNIFQLMTERISKNPDGTFPVDFKVDYVKVYKTMPQAV